MTPFPPFVTTPPPLTPTFSVPYWLQALQESVYCGGTKWRLHWPHRQESSFCWPVRPVRLCRLMSCLQRTQGSVPRGLGAPRKYQLLDSQPAGADGTPKSWSSASGTFLPGSACAGTENAIGGSSESLKDNFKFPGTIVCFTLGWAEFYSGVGKRVLFYSVLHF